MFCDNCGTQIPDDAKVCPNCGRVFETAMQQENTSAMQLVPGTVQGQNGPVQMTSPQPAPAQNMYLTGVPPMEQPGRKQGSGQILLIALLIVAVVALLAVVGLMISKMGSSSGNSGTSYAVSSKHGVLKFGRIVSDLNGNFEELDEGNVYGDYTSDRNMFLYTDSEGTLYYVTRDLKAVKVGKDVSSNAYLCSQDQRYISYQTTDNDLYLYDVKAGKAEKIAKDLDDYGNFSMSPDGKYLAYVDEDEVLYLYDGKESSKIEKNVDYCVAVFDKNRLYYIKGDKLYLHNDKENKKVLSEYGSNMTFDEHGDSFLYNDDDEKVYLYSVRKGESVKLGKGYLYGVATPFGGKSGFRIRGGNYLYAMPLVNFGGKVLMTSDGLSWIKPTQAEAVKICSDYDSAAISQDGKSLLYLKNDKLYYIKHLGDKMEETVLAKSVDTFVANENLSVVYYQDGDEIYFLTPGKDPVMITDDYDYDGMAFNRADDNLYLLLDDELYKAGRKENSLELIEEDVEDFFTGDNYMSFEEGILYYTYDGDYYYKEKGEPVKLFEEDDLY